jgi:hypothetical protein
MITERSTHVGCGITTFKIQENGRQMDSYVLACNYASANLENMPVYHSGAVGSGCTLGRDALYPGLCKVNEPINPNVF